MGMYSPAYVHVLHFVIWAEKQPCVQLLTNSTHFMEPENSLQRWQEPSTRLYSEPYQSNP
jgi:hypothetical protein